MAQKKKAYRRFEELTKRAMAPGSADAEKDRAAEETEEGGAGHQLLLTEPLSISLSPEVRRALELRAAADHTTESELVEEALRRFLEIRRRRFT
ncbi:MAG TPA: ribbon-helix-helix protein, CopG family [Acidimicrobiia bacterium]|nr:ribbon-helix-helix protein, CopG family [Acidimicrobiia bacterium]